MLEDKYVGLLLAIIGSFAIGSSIVITKKGLQDATERHGYEGSGYQYLKNPIWWAGMLTMALGELANFAAYAFAPAILVTPLGALSVLAGSVLGSYFLKERLGVLGKLGCAICILGSVIIASHAPPDEEIETVDQLLRYATKTPFLLYCVFVAIYSSVMIYKIAPIKGRESPIYYISICATVGSVSVMSVKAFGVALKLTINGNNQFTHPSTYAFLIVVAVSVLTQMNYFNKALNEFTSSIVNPLYYVMFTTMVLVASFILFSGFNTTSTVNTISLLCGFIIVFLGVYLLNLSMSDPHGHQMIHGRDETGMPTDGIAGIATRLSLQSRRSLDPRRSSTGSLMFSPRSPRHDRSDQDPLMRSYDVESNGFGLSNVAEEDIEMSYPLSPRHGPPGGTNGQAKPPTIKSPRIPDR